jgi:UDP-2,3-diacylglucosamine hydrolase
MALYIFSDAHLGSGPADKEALKREKITQLIDRVMVDGDRLIILGDLFDFWFEYRHAIPKENFDMLLLLREVSRQGIQIDYISGNHDFWMDDFFSEHLKIAVHRDALDVTYAGRRIYCLHGDGLAPADRGYRILKRVLRNRLAIWCYRKLPPDWAIPLAKAVSGSSREYTTRRDHTFAADYEEFARNKLDDGYDVVVIGHLHVPVYQEYGSGIYVNSGDFINHFSYVRVDTDAVALEHLA